MRYLNTLYIFLALVAGGCRGDEVVDFQEEVPLTPPKELPAITGFYLLNEGNMGTNSSTLDYYDYATGTYYRNIYGAANPDVPKELGDVGNDLEICRDRMYAVINCSNKVEVMEVATCRRVGQVEIPNCRQIIFDKEERYAYVTSYAGPVEISQDYRQKGYVAKVDLATLQVVARCTVGYQPDGLALADGKIYVANSGGYLVPNYETTLTVIDEARFVAVDTVEVAENLQYVVNDGRGHLWVSSRGDYYGHPARLFCLSLPQCEIKAQWEVASGSLWLDSANARLYCVGNSFNYLENTQKRTFACFDTSSASLITDDFLASCPQVRDAIRIPYGVAVNPDDGEILVTDGGSYVTPGRLYSFTPAGVPQWDVRTGEIPAHFAFTRVKVDISQKHD